MARPAPMQRLLQGDVGAGKTIVALLAAVVAMENGLQVAFMAPTEILAEQHYLTIRRLLAARRYDVALLTGTTGGADRRRRAGRARVGRRPARGRHARAGAGGRHVRAPRPGRHRRAASLRRDAAGRAAGQGLEPRRAGDDRDADPAHARADGLRRPGRVGDPRAAAGANAGRDAGDAAVASRRGLRAGAARARRRAPGVRRLPAGRGVGEGRRAGRDRDGRPPGDGGVSRVPRRAAARPAEAGGEGRA